MGQRVAFATFQQSAFPNFSAGFSGFPFRIFTLQQAQEIDPGFQVGPGTFWPLAMTLEDCVEFWWRIKKIDIGTISFSPDDPNIAFSISGTIDTNRENEIDLAQNNFRDFVKRFDITIGGEPTNADCILITEEFQIISSNGALYPQFVFQVSIDDFGIVALSVNASVGPQIATLNYKSYSAPLYAGGGYVLANPTVTLTPFEYYAYAATDGSPIYNTATGARLQDPRN